MARIVKIMKSRDGANRIVEIEYFKSKDCRLVGDKLVGSPTRITRGLESLYSLNQDALDSCKIQQFLQHKCCPPQDQLPTTPESQQQQQQAKNQEKEEIPIAENEPTTTTTIEELNPDINTTVWLEKANIHHDKSRDEQQPHHKLDEQQMNNLEPVHQEKNEQAQEVPKEPHQQLHQQQNQQQQTQQQQDEQPVDQNLVYQRNDKQKPIDHPQQQKPQEVDQHRTDQQMQLRQGNDEHHDPINIQNQSQEEEQKQVHPDEQEQKAKDPNIEFEIDQYHDIPKRVTRSRNNISRKSTRYLTDYVTE